MGWRASRARAARAGPSGGVGVTRRRSQGDERPDYFSFAALRNAAALSVFSHENAVKVSPLASFTS